MKTKINRVTVISDTGRRSSFFPAKIVDNVEVYRHALKEIFNARYVFFDMEEVEE